MNGEDNMSFLFANGVLVECTLKCLAKPKELAEWLGLSPFHSPHQ